MLARERQDAQFDLMAAEHRRWADLHLLALACPHLRPDVHDEVAQVEMAGIGQVEHRVVPKVLVVDA